jgi:hypothetical protein
MIRFVEAMDSVFLVEQRDEEWLVSAYTCCAHLPPLYARRFVFQRVVGVFATSAEAESFRLRCEELEQKRAELAKLR